MEDCDVVLPKTQMLKTAFEFFWCDKKIGQNQNQGSLGNAFSGLVQRGDQSGFTAGFRSTQLIQDMSQVSCAGLGGDFCDEFGTRTIETDGIALLRREIAQGTADPPCIIQFGV